MNFFSLDFLYIFILAFSLYWLITPFPHLQNALLLIFSYFFVASFSLSSALILLCWSVAIYLLAQAAYRFLSMRCTVALLILMVVTIFGCFKYYPTLREDIQEQFTGWGLCVDLPVLDVLVPLGLSFYVFNAVSYVIGVKQRTCQPGNVFNILLYLSFFATLVAGPLNRAARFLPQIASSRPRKILEPNRAIFLIALAIAKLFLCSAWLDETWVKNTFNNPLEASSGQTLLAIYACAWEIYFNFSGYTNLVTGIALLLGFHIAPNFAHPYLATHPGDFWRRWHISLSTFIRDYVYIPLGGNRHGFTATQRNALIAMVLSGVWHGAGLTFLVWGVLHGLGLIFHNLWRCIIPPAEHLKGMTTLISRFALFHFVCFGWIFFRASDMASALTMIRQLVTSDGSLLQPAIYLPVMGFLGLLACYPLLVTLRTRLASALQHLSWYLVPVPVTLLLATVFFFAPSGIPGFIYANF